MTKLLVGLIFIISVFVGTIAQAQVGITAVPFLQVNNNAASVGLAEADVAKTNSRNGLHLNPATIGGLDGLDVSSQFYFVDGLSLGTEWLPSSNNDFSIKTPQVILSYGKFSIGYEHTYFEIGSTNTIEGPPGFNSSHNSYEFSNTFALAFRANQFISIGIGYTKFKSVLRPNSSLFSSLDTEGSTYDLGTHFKYPLEISDFSFTPVLGISLTDIGEEVKYNGVSRADPLPTMFRIGSGFELRSIQEMNKKSVFSVSVYVSLAKVMARFKEDGQPYTGWEAVLNSWDTYTYFNGVETVELSLGEQFQRSMAIEFSYFEIVSFRLGRFVEDPLNGDRNYNTIGFGINYKYFELDYASIYIDDDEDFSPLNNTRFFQFSVNLPLSLITSD